MKFTKSLLFFLLINFGGLAFGSWLMNNGPMSDWYIGLNQAPWTPPGWVFGFAWTTIMACFSIYLVFLFRSEDSKFLRWLFAFQVFLNIIWNFIFFNQHLVALGLICILSLTFLIFYFFFKYGSGPMNNIRYLLFPYMIWLCIACSLNAYILINN